jgi:hypothetical protein
MSSATVSASPWGRSSTTGATGSRTEEAAVESARRDVTLYSSLMSAFSVSPCSGEPMTARPSRIATTRGRAYLYRRAVPPTDDANGGSGALSMNREQHLSPDKLAIAWEQIWEQNSVKLRQISATGCDRGDI